jgi:predicted GNAT family acetyltransferase
MQIQRDEHGKKGAFYIEDDGEWVAELTYFRSGQDVITVDHTEVDESLRGEGVGQQLVKAAVDFARENNLRIKPACPYFRGVVDTTPEFKEVLAD